MPHLALRTNTRLKACSHRRRPNTPAVSPPDLSRGNRRKPPFEIVWIENECPHQPDHASKNRSKADEIITEVRKAIENAQLVST